MPKLTVSSAARVIGLPRSTLRGAIARGRVHVEQGNLVDTAELARAGYTLQPEALALEAARRQGRSRTPASPSAETQPAAIPVYPRGDLEHRILETLRAYSPMPIASVQLAVMVGESRARVLAFMQALATLGTIARPTRSYYQHIPLPEGGAGSDTQGGKAHA
jgi:hypothetical protein